MNKVNHNLNTSAEFYEQICSTHTYADRVGTLQAVRDAGLELCSGGIIGMGERDIDVVRMALALRELEVESIPLNFLIDIEGTALHPHPGRRRLHRHEPDRRAGAGVRLSPARLTPRSRNPLRTERFRHVPPAVHRQPPPCRSRPPA